MKLFTYGTLMKGECRHDILADAEYLGDAILHDYCLQEIGSFPGAVPKEGYEVFGEVYEIPEELITTLDWIEGEGYLYKRKTVEVELNGTEADVLFYEFLKDDGRYEIKMKKGKWNR